MYVTINMQPHTIRIECRSLFYWLEMLTYWLEMLRWRILIDEYRGDSVMWESQSYTKQLSPFSAIFHVSSQYDFKNNMHDGKMTKRPLNYRVSRANFPVFKWIWKWLFTWISLKCSDLCRSCEQYDEENKKKKTLIQHI